MLNKVVFVDRDGVINKKAAEHDYIKNWQEFRFLPDIAKAIKLLNQSGFIVIIVSNQRGIARGIMTENDLKDIHQKMCCKLKRESAIITDIFVCPHNNNECKCRKPQTGLFLQAEIKYPVNKKQSFMVGDSTTDIEAGKNYGIKTIAVGGLGLGADYQCSNLLEAAKYITGVTE